jgi:HlyD family secretion protein
MFFKYPFAFAVLVAVVCQAAIAQPPTAPPGSASGSPDGILRPWKEGDAATAETGLIYKLHVKVGDVVKAGQPIAELDSQAVQIQLETARVQAASQGRLITAQAEVALYKRKLELLSAMHQKNQSNELEEERARVDLRMAEGRLQGEMDDIRVLQLQVERLEEQLSERVIRAPISGVVVKLHKEIGEFVAANTPQVARIADVSRLKAIFYLTDNEVRQLPKDKKLRVRVSSGQAVPALFDYVLPYANDESGLIEMQVLIEHPNDDILGSRCQLLTPGPST